MPAKSQQQQKFMGLVHAYKKGEVPASKVSKAVKDAAKSMSNKSVKKYAKTKHDELPKKVTEKKERDYKAEYKKFQSSTKAKKYRAELNKYNRQKGTYGNGDGKDASHKGGKIVGFEAQSKNRGRKEKSRLKKESAFSVKIDTFQNALKNLDKLSDILKKGGEKKKSMMVSKLVKQLQQAFFRKEIVENITEDITKLEKLAMNLLRNINKNAGVKNYDHKKTADFNKVVKFLKGKMPKVPNQRIGQIAMSYHDYRKKQPKIRIPDIDSVKDMEKTLKKLGMKEGINERAWTPAQEKAVKELDKKFYKLIGKKGIEPYTYEASQMWTSGGFRKEMRKIFGKDESINEREMSIKDAYKDLVKDHGAKKALDMLADVLTGGALAAMDDKKVKAFKKKLLKKMMKESVNEKVYHFKGFTNKQMDELDAMLYRAGVRGTPDFNKRTYTVDKEIPKLDKIMKMKGGKKVNEYEYKVGDMVKDVNPTCPHNGAIGKVKSVNPKSVVFIVKNKGDNYEPGDVLDKTHDQMEKIKENKQEKLQIAKTILSQLGGNRFIAMTGAKSFGYDSKGSVVSLQFKIGRNAKQVNIVRINYIKGKDLYEMNFYKGAKLLKKVSNVYADQLRKIFTKHTGMYTSL